MSDGGRRAFVPVVGLGIGGAVLVAVAGGRTLMEIDGGSRGPGVVGVGVGQLPLATTLAMVVLACWGVLLVTRGRVRRGVAALGTLASAGALTTWVTGWWTLPHSLRTWLDDLGFQAESIDVTSWYWIGLAGAVLSAAASVVAVLLARSWPEMGTRYDEPTGGRAPADTPDDASSLDLWKALDQGRDPTA